MKHQKRTEVIQFEPSNHHHRQSERWRRQDNNLRQFGHRAGPSWEKGTVGGRWPPGQSYHQSGQSSAGQAALYPVRRYGPHPYARLLEEKKKIYAEYRRSREEMRELLAAKANVDRLLKLDEEQKKEQEKEHDQRWAGHAPKRSQNAQPQNGILRSWGLGGYPQQAAPEAEWLSRSIACQYYRKVLITRLSNNRITERSLVYQSRDYPKFCLKLPYSVD